MKYCTSMDDIEKFKQINCRDNFETKISTHQK